MIDLTSQETGLKKCLGASLIKWRHSAVQCLDFHKKGKARIEWDKLWLPGRDGLFYWDHIIRAQITPKAQEYVLIKAYRSIKEFRQTKKLSYQTDQSGYANLLSTGFNLPDNRDLSPWINNSPDYALRLSIAGWRKNHGMCGRVLCAFNCSATHKQEQWQELIDKTHKQYGINEKHSLSHRIFHFFYNQ